MKIGIIGCGIITQEAHVPALVELKDTIEVIALCNHSRPKAEHTAMLLGKPSLPIYSDWKEMFRPVSSRRPGTPVSDFDPGLGNDPGKKNPSGQYVSLEEATAAEPEVVFAALPHLKSAEVCAPFFGRTVVIDLSADFRIKDPDLFQAAYGMAPPRPDLLDRAVFGLTEIYRDQVRTADLIANPGCYPTATLLPLLPVVKRFGAQGKIIVNALSGISGAGRKASLNLIFTERSENCGAYNPGRKHRHTQEIEKEVKLIDPAGEILFTPHLVPLKRGMAVTTVVTLPRQVTEAEVEECFQDAYGSSPFVQLCGGRVPETAHVRGSNRCDIGWHREGDSLMLFSAIDNLVKGASGQAVQNMNIRFGFEETAGLSLFGQV